MYKCVEATCVDINKHRSDVLVPFLQRGVWVPLIVLILWIEDVCVSYKYFVRHGELLCL